MAIIGGINNSKIAVKLAKLQAEHIASTQRVREGMAMRIKWIDEHADELGVEKSRPQRRICPSCFIVEDGRPHRPKCKINPINV